MRRAIAVALVAIGLCLAAFAAPAAASPARVLRDQQGPTARPAGLRQAEVDRRPHVALRDQLVRVQPHQRPQNFSATDKLVGDLAARGIRPLPFIYGSPTLGGEASPTGRPLGSAEEACEAWRRFLTSVVKRYGPGGAYWTGPYDQQHPGAKPKPITAWQIWNEPTLPKFFPRKRGAQSTGSW